MIAAEEERAALQRIVDLALAEDRAGEDATSQAVVSPEARARGFISAGTPGILAGCAHAEAVFRSCDPGVRLDWLFRDGQRVAPGDRILCCEGNARALLAAERTALNFLQHLSGVATLTAQAVEHARGVAVLETRKTLPGLRQAEKDAVRAGGGVNHRRDLADGLLLKENHFALSPLGYEETVVRARAAAGTRQVGAEARNLEEARAALRAGADYVLLDNFQPGELAAVAAALRAEFPSAVLEASGGLRPDDLATLAGVGLDRVSLGALTHSAPACDFSFLLEACS